MVIGNAIHIAYVIAIDNRNLRTSTDSAAIFKSGIYRSEVDAVLDDTLVPTGTDNTANALGIRILYRTEIDTVSDLSADGAIASGCIRRACGIPTRRRLSDLSNDAANRTSCIDISRHRHVLNRRIDCRQSPGIVIMVSETTHQTYRL